MVEVKGLTVCQQSVRSLNSRIVQSRDWSCRSQPPHTEAFSWWGWWASLWRKGAQPRPLGCDDVAHRRTTGGGTFTWPPEIAGPGDVKGSSTQPIGPRRRKEKLCPSKAMHGRSLSDGCQQWVQSHPSSAQRHLVDSWRYTCQPVCLQ